MLDKSVREYLCIHTRHMLPSQAATDFVIRCRNFVTHYYLQQDGACLGPCMVRNTCLRDAGILVLIWKGQMQVL